MNHTPFTPVVHVYDPSPRIYTEDWFSALIPSWTEHLVPLRRLAEPLILEVGAFEGRSTIWLMETFPTAIVMTIDPFADILGYSREQAEQIHARFLQNVAPFGPRCALMRQPSSEVLPWLMGRDRRFDFIYVDGSHWAQDVILDAVLGYRLLKPHGLMCFDDFLWGDSTVPADQSPQPAITAFLTSHIGRVELIAPIHRQAWVRKL